MRYATMIGCVALAVGATTSAQDGSEAAVNRTPAGAVKFLDTVAKRGGMGIGHYATREVTVTAFFSGVVAESDCLTRFDGRYAFMKLDPPALSGEFGKAEDAANAEKFLAATGFTAPPKRIDWSRVGSIVRTSQPIHYSSWIDEAKYLRIDGVTWFFPDVRTAERAEFAIRYLVERCSLAEVEGF